MPARSRRFARDEVGPAELKLRALLTGILSEATMQEVDALLGEMAGETEQDEPATAMDRRPLRMGRDSALLAARVREAGYRAASEASAGVAEMFPSITKIRRAY